jgi:hypothetical protein
MLARAQANDSGLGVRTLWAVAARRVLPERGWCDRVCVRAKRRRGACRPTVVLNFAKSLSSFSACPLACACECGQSGTTDL